MADGKFSNKEFLTFDIFGCIWKNEKFKLCGFLMICYIFFDIDLAYNQDFLHNIKATRHQYTNQCIEYFKDGCEKCW